MTTNYLMPDWDIYTEPGRSPIRECRTHTVDEPKRDDFWDRPKGTMPNPWMVLFLVIIAGVIIYRFATNTAE